MYNYLCIEFIVSLYILSRLMDCEFILPEILWNFDVFRFHRLYCIYLYNS